MAPCRKALRAQAQALAEQPFSREAYARDPKQARPGRLAPCCLTAPVAVFFCLAGRRLCRAHHAGETRKTGAGETSFSLPSSVEHPMTKRVAGAVARPVDFTQQRVAKLAACCSILQERQSVWAVRMQRLMHHVVISWKRPGMLRTCRRWCHKEGVACSAWSRVKLS